MVKKPKISTPIIIIQGNLEIRKNLLALVAKIKTNLYIPIEKTNENTFYKNVVFRKTITEFHERFL